MKTHRSYQISAWRRFAARLGLSGLLLQALFPLIVLGLTPSTPALAWDQVVLCTVDGPKTVSLGALLGDDQPPTSEKAPHHLPYCPACPGFVQAYTAITPPVVLAAAPSRVETLHVSPADERGPDGRRHHPQSARAPPFFA
jgi:hypothetical protein